GSYAGTTRSPSSGAASVSRRIATASSRRRSAGGWWDGAGSGRPDPSSTGSSRCGGIAARRDGPPALDRLGRSPADEVPEHERPELPVVHQEDPARRALGPPVHEAEQ